MRVYVFFVLCISLFICSSGLAVTKASNSLIVSAVVVSSCGLNNSLSNKNQDLLHFNCDNHGAYSLDLSSDKETSGAIKLIPINLNKNDEPSSHQEDFILQKDLLKNSSGEKIPNMVTVTVSY